MKPAANECASFMSIQDFSLRIRQNSLYLEVKREDSWSDINQPCNLLIGYKSSSSTSGEYIELFFSPDRCEIRSDNNGCIPIYRFRDNESEYLTTNLQYSVKLSNKNICLNEKLTKKYFSIGYNCLDDETHYDGIALLQEPGQKILVKKNNVKIYSDYNYVFSNKNNNIVEVLLDSISSKLKGLDHKKTLLLLSGGNDSLICALATKLLGHNLDTATFGSANSHDLRVARKRSKLIFPESNHHEYIITDNNFQQEILDNHTISQNGFGTLSNINYTQFLKKIRNLGYKNIIFGDYFEVMRKRLDRRMLEESYLTPEAVLNKFFKDLGFHKNLKSELTKEIKEKYKNDPYDNFYLHDRTIKGCSWKNSLCRANNLTKITYAFDTNFQGASVNRYKTQGNFHEEIMTEMYHQSGYLAHELNPHLDNTQKHQPSDPNLILYENSSLFLEHINNCENTVINNLFELETISSVISKEQLKKNDNWFILRLANLINFLRLNQPS